jgi:hypothetical protein
MRRSNSSDGDSLNSYRRVLTAISQMSNHSSWQTDDRSPSGGKPSRQVLTLAACPTVDHDVGQGEVPSSSRPTLSSIRVAVMAASGGIACQSLLQPADAARNPCVYA